MTIQKAYISNLSPVWPVARQETLLAEIEGTRYKDELDSSERRGYRINGLAERSQMLRPTTRKQEQIIFVASLACLARNSEDLMLVLTQADDLNATIRDVTAKVDIKPGSKAKELKRAAEIFTEGRKRALEEERGSTGGKASGELRSRLAKETALKFERDWAEHKKSNKQIVKESGVSINTLKTYLGLRKDARRNYVAALKRGKLPWDNRGRKDVELKAIPYVYLMRREDGVYKIGFSANPMKRTKDLRGEFGKRFRLAKTWQRKDAYRVESLAHRILKEQTHLKSEGWETFKAPRKALIDAIEEAIRKCDEGEPA